MTLLAWLLVACGSPPPSAPEPALPPVAPAARAVWIDTDPSVGEPDRDVDDGVALLQALRSPELAVRGVSVVFGNAPQDRADPIARELMAAWAPAVPVHTGAATAGLTATPASEALARALTVEPLDLLVLGPATNVATVLHAHPELAPRVRSVVAVAGRRPGQRFTTGTTNPRGHRDFNFEQDADAFQVILDAGVPLTLAPFEVSSKVWVRAARLDAWERGPAARLVEPARGWLDLWVRTFGVDGFNPFDTLAVAVLTSPELLRCEPGRARIEEGADDRTATAMQGGTAPVKPYLHVRAEGEGAQVSYCYDVRGAEFLSDLDARLGATVPAEGSR